MINAVYFSAVATQLTGGSMMTFERMSSELMANIGKYLARIDLEVGASE